MTYKARPTNCNICGGPLIFVQMKKIGIRPYQSGWCYYCSNCDKHIATHKTRYRDAIGIIADDETKYLRAKCHELMDKTYRTSAERSIKYSILRKELGLKESECHFGHMDKEMLNKALKVMQKWKIVR